MTLLQATRAAHAERTGKSAAEVADLDFCCMSREDVIAAREAAKAAPAVPAFLPGYCAACNAKRVTRTCAGCGLIAELIDCGHYEQPAIIAASAIDGRAICAGCEARRELAASIFPACDDGLTFGHGTPCGERAFYRIGNCFYCAGHRAQGRILAYPIGGDVHFGNRESMQFADMVRALNLEAGA